MIDDDHNVSEEPDEPSADTSDAPSEDADGPSAPESPALTESADAAEPDADGELDTDAADADTEPHLSAADYAARRAARRSERRNEPRPPDERLIWFAVITGGVVVLAVFLYFFWPVMQARLDAVKQIDQAQALLGQAEGSIAQIDQAVTAQLSPEAAPAVRDTSAQILVARRELDQATKLIGEAMPRITEDEQKRAELLRTAIAARRTMIDGAPAILVASVKAVKAKMTADQAWSLDGRANTALGSAMSQYELKSASAVESATVAVVTIKDELAQARSLYSKAALAFPEAGFSRYVAAVDAKVQTASMLGSASKLWLAHNIAGAAAVWSGRTALDKKLQAASKAVPGEPGVATGQGFRKIAGASVDAYEKAKTQALNADKAIKTP